jgi:hypothetical protein
MEPGCPGSCQEVGNEPGAHRIWRNLKVLTKLLWHWRESFQGNRKNRSTLHDTIQIRGIQKSRNAKVFYVPNGTSRKAKQLPVKTQPTSPERGTVRKSTCEVPHGQCGLPPARYGLSTWIVQSEDNSVCCMLPALFMHGLGALRKKSQILEGTPTEKERWLHSGWQTMRSLNADVCGPIRQEPGECSPRRQAGVLCVAPQRWPSTLHWTKWHMGDGKVGSLQPGGVSLCICGNGFCDFVEGLHC